MIAPKIKLRVFINLLAASPGHPLKSRSSQEQCGQKRPRSFVLVDKDNNPYPMKPADRKFWELNLIDQDRLNLNEYSVSVSRANPKRNRYSNVSPYDATRVRLPLTQNDYINASYINLPNNWTYIACQGPMPETISHFWAMAFNEAEKAHNDTIVVIMLTPLMEQSMVKCHQYWPSTNESWDLDADDVDLNGVKITNISKEAAETGNFSITTLTLEANGKTKTVKHFYYSHWLDAKVPPSASELYELSDAINELRVANPGVQLVPIVHCLAGVGRTGTFIAVDQLKYGVYKDAINDTAELPIASIVEIMRNHRMMMVQTVYQYRWLEDVYEQMRKASNDPINSELSFEV